MKNYYSVLQVNNFADLDCIKSNYKELIKKTHPDKGGNSEEFQQIKEAFDVLNDPIKKKIFDNELTYHIDILERAEVIYLSKGERDFSCVQCQCVNEINTCNLKENVDNIYKCDNCSLIYKIII